MKEEPDQAETTIKKGDKATLESITVKTHSTTPPARFTEPQLVAKLEDLGIGRPSTYANIVTVNQERGYAHKKGGALAPTWQGMKVAQLLEAEVPDFVSYDYTANMETELDKIADGTLPKAEFLKNAWAGENGIDRKVNGLQNNINWDEINKITTIQLPSGYQVRVNKAGAWLEDPKEPVDENGYRKGAKVNDDLLFDEDALTPEACKTLLDKATASEGARDLGVLPSGAYKGWKVTLRDGKYGAYAQAVKLTRSGAPAKGSKPVNMTLPQELLTDDPDKGLSKLTMDDVLPLFTEAKLPRTLDAHFFVGISKRGPWVGWKKTAKSRKAQFKSLPEGVDPRTVTLEDVKKIWEES